MLNFVDHDIVFVQLLMMVLLDENNVSIDMMTDVEDMTI
jgi:hypothetical protein